MELARLLGERYPWLGWSTDELQAEIRDRLRKVQQINGIVIQPQPLNTYALLSELDRLWKLDQICVQDAQDWLSATAQLANKLQEHQGLRLLAGLLLEPNLLERLGSRAADQPVDLRVLVAYFQKRYGQLEQAKERYSSVYYTLVSCAKAINPY